MFTIEAGPRGISAQWNGRLLASAYDAEREARRWCEELAPAAGSLVFVAGDPWGLAAQAAAQAGAQAVALLPGSAARTYLPAGLASWAPEDGELETFLSDVLDASGPDSVSWQVWPAFERAAAELALDWSRRFRDVYRAVQGSWLTQTKFGPRYWTNAVRNAVEWEQPAALHQGTRPLVIAASGPSLEESLPLLERYRGRFDLWALPSSFEVLLRRGLIPDAGVATDGGYYAREHLQRLAGSGVPVLAALASAPDPVLSDRPCLFFSQGMPIERELLGTLVPGFGEIPSQGTVAVTAIRLALEATSGPVLVAGLDLAFRGLRAHASPHTVDRRLAGSRSRLYPNESQLAENLFAQRPLVRDGALTAPALITYAGWFRTRAQFARPVYRVAPSALHWDSMTEVSVEQAGALLAGASGQGVRWGTPPWPNREHRREAVGTAIERLAARIETCSDDDPWLIEAARTGAPRALAADFKARRVGQPSGQAREALALFVRGLVLK